jgi:hypothetical protein
MKTERKYSNLKFHGKINYKWRNDDIGDNLKTFVKSIEFHKCKIARASLEILILSFPNLEEIIFTYSEFLDPTLKYNFPKFKLKCLKKLSIDDRMTYQSDQTECFIGYFGHLYNLESIELPSFINDQVNFRKLVEVQKDLKKLKTCGFFDWNLMNLFKLESLDSCFVYGDRNAFITSLNSQEMITHINLKILRMSPNNLTNLFRCVLSRQHLKEFKIKANYGLPDLPDVSFFSNYSSNLKKLEIINHNKHEVGGLNFLKPLIKACPNLEKLFIFLPKYSISAYNFLEYKGIFTGPSINHYLKVLENSCELIPEQLNSRKSPEFPPSEGKDFQLWLYGRNLNFLMEEEMVSSLQDLESLAVFVPSIHHIPKIVNTFKNLKLLRVVINNFILMELRIIRSKSGIVYQFKNILVSFECDFKVIESLHKNLIHEYKNITNQIRNNPIVLKKEKNWYPIWESISDYVFKFAFGLHFILFMKNNFYNTN